MNRTTIIIAGVIVAILFLGIGLFFLLRSGPAQKDVDLVTPGSLLTTTPTADSIQLPAGQDVVVMDNFFDNPETVAEGYNQYELSGDVNEAIRYDAATNTFTLSINPANVDEFNTMRTEIEQRFLDVLHISKSDACQLNVVIATAPAPDEPISSKRFSLSFCN